MNFRKSRNLMWIGFAVGLLICSITMGTEQPIFLAIGMIVFMAALIQAFIFYTCPHCGYSLMNVRGDVPEHCPKCGKELK